MAHKPSEDNDAVMRKNEEIGEWNGLKPRHRTPHYPGVYIKGSLQGVQTIFTVDTGASRTLVSMKLYESIPSDRRPILEAKKCAKLVVGVDGKALQLRGMGLFEMCLGPLHIERQLVVADISDEVILGADIIQQDPDGPGDLLLSQDKLLLKGASIPLKQVGLPPRIRRACVADHNVIPGISEILVDVHVNRRAVDIESSMCDEDMLRKVRESNLKLAEGPSSWLYYWYHIVSWMWSLFMWILAPLKPIQVLQNLPTEENQSGDFHALKQENQAIYHDDGRLWPKYTRK